MNRTLYDNVCSLDSMQAHLALIPRGGEGGADAIPEAYDDDQTNARAHIVCCLRFMQIFVLGIYKLTLPGPSSQGCVTQHISACISLRQVGIQEQLCDAVRAIGFPWTIFTFVSGAASVYIDSCSLC